MVSEPVAWEHGESTASALITHSSRSQSSQKGQTLLHKIYKQMPQRLRWGTHGQRNTQPGQSWV